MALDIAALFGAYNKGTQALLEAAGLPPSMYADTAPAAAPAAAAPAAGPAAPAPQTPADFLAAATRYKSKNRGRGLLDALAARHPTLGSSRPWETGHAGIPAAPATALERVVHTAAHGPRAGQGFQEFDLGDGRFSHVFYDKSGKRQAVTFRR